MILRVLGSMGQAVCRLCLNLSFSDVFLIVRLGFLGFGGEDCRDGAPFSTQGHQGRLYPLDWSLMVLTGRLAKEVFARLLYCKVTFLFPPFPNCVLWKQVTKQQDKSLSSAKGPQCGRLLLFPRQVTHDTHVTERGSLPDHPTRT